MFHSGSHPHPILSSTPLFIPSVYPIPPPALTNCPSPSPTSSRHPVSRWPRRTWTFPDAAASSTRVTDLPPARRPAPISRPARRLPFRRLPSIACSPANPPLVGILLPNTAIPPQTSPVVNTGHWAPATVPQSATFNPSRLILILILI
ncbi:hypothetical protein G7046_g3606 [Stylonectria norvegica]|nr:hypothetical protein G7046_g3606 [Stylonectria norvegica]